MKKLPVTLVSMTQMEKTTLKVFELCDILNERRKFEDVTALLTKYLAFVDRQLGEGVEGKSYCRRSNGELIDNQHKISIRIELSRTCFQPHVQDIKLRYAMEARELLAGQVRNYGDDIDPTITIAQNEAERLMAQAYLEKGQFDLAELHCEQSLVYARAITSGRAVRASHMSMGLMAFANLRGLQHRYVEAIAMSEEGYILLSETHGPVHTDVQEMAFQLIQLLIANRDFDRADNYCRMNNENLMDRSNGLDQKGYKVAQGMMQVATIWLNRESVEKDEKAALALEVEAEDMIRRAYSIFLYLYHPDSNHLVIPTGVFGGVLLRRKKITEETRSILERSLALNRLTKAPLTSHLRKLASFHHYVSETMPPGPAQSRELDLRDEYSEEAGDYVRQKKIPFIIQSPFGV